MNMNGGEDNDLVPAEFGNLATTIALASDALAAAAEILAGVATEMSHASSTFGAGDVTEISSGTTHTTSAPAAPDYQNNMKTNDVTIGSLGRADQYAVPAISLPKPSTISVLSDFGSAVESVPYRLPTDEQVSISQPSGHTARDDTLLMHDTPQLDNLCAPIVTRFSGNETIPHLTSRNDINSLQSLSKVFAAMESYTPMPSGRNYINLERESDALAFIGYMALQVNKTICLVPDKCMSACSIFLESLTGVKTYCVKSFAQFQNLSVAFETIPKPASRNVMLVPPLFMSYLSSTQISPDCVLHWGQPSSTYIWVNQILNFIPTNVRVCVMLVGEQYFNGISHGVLAYPNVALTTCHDPNSPFQLLRQIVSELNLPTSIEVKASKLHANSSPFAFGPSSTSALATPSQTNTMTYPTGHHYIVLDTANDIDIIPMIACIALGSTKAICHIPIGKDLNIYQKLIQSISGVSVLPPSLTNSKKAKKGTNVLQSTARGVLLRAVGKHWDTRFSKSLADCLTHWGLPPNISSYADQCRTKVQRSYLILTKEQYSRSQSALASWRIEKHPHIRADDSSRPGTLLYDLQQKLMPYLP